MSAPAASPMLDQRIADQDVCPLANWQIDTLRSEIHTINTELDLWGGIFNCVTAGGEWKEYSDFQIAWNWALLYGKHLQNVWVGARNSGKTQTTIEGLVRVMALRPRTLISFIPGGNQRQNAEPSRYFNTIVNNSSVMSLEKGEPWQEAIKTFKNGSRIWFLPPTLDGVQSMRGNVQIFDEAQKLDKDVQAAALPQAGVKGTRRFYTGISQADTIIDAVYHNPYTGFRIHTPIKAVIKAGIVDQHAIEDTIAADLLTEDQIKVMYLSEWVRASDRVFYPIIINEVPADMSEGFWTVKCLGVDFNPSAGHWGVFAVQDINGNVICLREYVTKMFEGILDMAPEGDLHCEDGGTNTGYCDALQLANSRRLSQRKIVREAWDDVLKGQQVATVIRLQEGRKWYIYRRGCPILARDVCSIPFNEKGVPDKEKAKKNNKNAHVVDAMIHAVAGAACESSTAYIMKVMMG